MKCPNCAHKISSALEICPHCQINLKMYNTIGSLVDNVSEIKTETDSLTKRIEHIQQQLSKLKNDFTSPKVQKEAKPQDDLIEETQSKFEISEAVIEEFERSKHRRLKITDSESEIRLGQKWILIAGIFITILAVGWFLKYSFEKNWVGPEGKAIMAYCISVIFFAAGEVFRRRDYRIFGLYIIGGSIAIAYFATFASFQIYLLIPKTLAFIIMLFITIFAGTLSIIFQTKWLAVLGLIGGFLTPFILDAGLSNQSTIMTYITLLNLCIFFVAFFQQWRLLTNLGFLFTWILFTDWYIFHYSDGMFWSTLIFLNIFFLIYALAPFVYHIMKEHEHTLKGVGIIIPNAFIAFGYSFGMIKSHFKLEYVSIATLSYAIICFAMAWFIYQRNHKQLRAFIMLLSQSILFLLLSVPILFSQNWIAFFWALQATLLLWGAMKLDSLWFTGYSTLIMISAIVQFFMHDYNFVFHLDWWKMSFTKGYTYLMGERFISSIIIFLCLFACSRILSYYKIHKNQIGLKKMPAIYWGITTVILFSILNIEVGALFYEYSYQARFASVSVLWTLFSLGMIITGFIKQLTILRRYAIGLFGITIIKVFFIDMANVSTPYRIVSFLVLGFILIAVSYLYHRFKDRILQQTAIK